jgi:hypothetical protein
MIQIVLPFYMNQGMLAIQYENWCRYEQPFRFIIVDDGSPEPAAEVPRPEGLDIEIYRIKEDRPWHQHAARNLGAYVAQDGWLLMTDMDHVLTAESAEHLSAYEVEESEVYMLDRVEADTGLPTLAPNGLPKPHPNSFFLTKEMFWKVGGYDERATGIYGTDKLFRSRAFSVGKQAHLKIPLVRYWRDIVPDASTTTLPRKEGRDAELRTKIMASIAREPEKRVTLNFEWERVV